MALPQLQAQGGGQNIDKVFTQMQTLWAALINPIISRVQNQSNLLLVDDSVSPPNLAGIPLAIGTNTINHKLNRKLTGWNIIGQDAKASIYDAQGTNKRAEFTLILISDAAVNVKLEVF